MSSDLFGGSKSSSGVQDATPKEFKQLRPDLKRVFENLLAKGKNADPLAGIPEFEGPLAAPIAAGETAGLAQVAAGANNAQRQGLLDQTMSGQFLSQGSNPFLADAISAAQRQTAETYQHNIDRVLKGQFAGAGHRTQPGQSSPFDTAAAIESRGFANALGDIASNMQFGAYEAERGRQQEAIKLSQAEVDTSIKNLQAQALPRMIEQYGIDAGLQHFQKRADSLLQLLGILSGGMVSQQVGTSQSKTAPNIAGTIMGGAGAAALAGSLQGGGE